MSKTQLFGANIDPACSCCEHSLPLENTHLLQCPYKGKREPSDRCRRFRYDPLRREPTPQVSLPGGFDREDFTL